MSYQDAPVFTSVLIQTVIACEKLKGICTKSQVSGIYEFIEKSNN